MARQEDIDQQQVLLATHRRTQAVYLRRLASLSAAHAPPEVFHGIAEARAGIARCKATLRSWGVVVDDHPDDDDTIVAQATGNRPVDQATQGQLVTAEAGMRLVSPGDQAHSKPASTLPKRHDISRLAALAGIIGLFIVIVVLVVLFGHRKMRFEITVVSVTIHAIPQPEPLDLLEPKDEGDITINFNVAGQPRRWPVEPQVKHIHVGDTVQIGEAFQGSVAPGDTPMLAIDVLEMDPEKGNENDLLLRATQLIDLTSAPQTPRVIRDQANGYAEIAYTVTVTPIP